MELRQITAPTAQPITLEEAKQHLRVDGTADDAVISALIPAAVQHVEGVTHRALMPQEWTCTWVPEWTPSPGCMARLGLPYPPLRSVSAAVTLADDGTATTIAGDAYRVEAPSGPFASAGALVARSGWPWDGARVRVTYAAGYADAASVPAALKAAVLLVLGDLFENREGGSQTRPYQENPTVGRLLRPFVVSWP